MPASAAILAAVRSPGTRHSQPRVLLPALQLLAVAALLAFPAGSPAALKRYGLTIRGEQTVKIDGSAQFTDGSSGCTYTRTEQGTATYRFKSKSRSIQVAGTIPARGTNVRLNVTASGNLTQTTAPVGAGCPAIASVNESFSPKQVTTSLSLAFFPFSTERNAGPMLGFAPEDKPAYLSSEKNLFGGSSLLGEHGGFLPQGLKRWSFSKFRKRRFVIKHDAVSDTGVDIAPSPEGDLHCQKPGTGTCIPRRDTMKWTATFKRTKRGSSRGGR
jgi:hypothetical protein